MPHEVHSKMLRQSAVFSTPGKVILFGEHSVVYGKRALAISLGLRSELTISVAKDVVELHLPEINLEQSWPISSLFLLWDQLKSEDLIQNDSEPRPLSPKKEVALRKFLGCVDDENEKNQLGLITFLHLYTSIFPSPISFSVCVKSEMPVGAGLGSSAAYGVCLSSALLWAAGKINSPDMTIPNHCLEIVCQWALYCDLIIHGKCSGIDNSICTFGGCVNFKAGEIKRFDPPPLKILLINTNISRNSKTLIEGVRKKYDRLTSVMDPLLTSFDKVVEVAVETLNEIKDINHLGNVSSHKYFVLNELIDMNHCLLNAIGVSHPSLESLVRIAKNYNLHAKLTGAGGGGFGIILITPNTEEKDLNGCIRALDAEGFTTIITELGGKGLSYKIITK